MVAAAGNPNVTADLLKGVKLGERTYKNHLDGYNQMDLLTGKGPSKREEFFYFGGPHLGAVRIGDFKYQFYQQPWGWPGAKVTTDMPTIVNIRQDPFERTPGQRGQSMQRHGRRLHERLLRPRVLAIRLRAAAGGQAGQYRDRVPPMQDPASFNLDAIKKKIEEAIRHQRGQ